MGSNAAQQLLVFGPRLLKEVANSPRSFSGDRELASAHDESRTNLIVRRWSSLCDRFYCFASDYFCSSSLRKLVP